MAEFIFLLVHLKSSKFQGHINKACNRILSFSLASVDFATVYAKRAMLKMVLCSDPTFSMNCEGNCFLLSGECQDQGLSVMLQGQQSVFHSKVIWAQIWTSEASHRQYNKSYFMYSERMGLLYVYCYHKKDGIKTNTDYLQNVKHDLFLWCLPKITGLVLILCWLKFTIACCFIILTDVSVTPMNYILDFLKCR